MGDTFEQSTVTASIWTDRALAPLLQSVIELLAGEVRLLAAGGPPSATLEGLTRSQGCASRSDLRQMMVEQRADYLLLGTMEGASLEDVQNALAGGATVLALEPVADALQDTAKLNPRSRSSSPPQAPIIPMPSFLCGPNAPHGTEVSHTLAGRRTMCVESYGQRGQASLFARMFDAWQTILGFAEMPQSIDAHLDATSGQSPRKLRGLSGRLTAHARMADGSSAAMMVSDRAGQADRRLNLLSDAGQLRLTDTSLDLFDQAGQTIESQSRMPSTGAVAWADLIADQWRRLIDRHRPPITDQEGPLACCLACLLSARTGEPEDPQTLRQMR